MLCTTRWSRNNPAAPDASTAKNDAYSAEKKLTLEVSAAAEALIAGEGYDPVYGARPLKRAIQRLLQNPLALAVLTCLYERPMHPYEMAQTLRTRAKHESIRLNYGSLYSVVESLLEKLPGGAKLQAQLKNARPERDIGRAVAIINSMTVQERRFPDLIKASRKRRIAAGAGVQVMHVNQLLPQFETAQKMMKMVSKCGMAKMLRGMTVMLPGMR